MKIGFLLLIVVGLFTLASAHAAQISGRNVAFTEKGVGGNTYYLHLAGIAERPMDGLLTELEDKFAKVLHQQKSEFNFSYVASTQGAIQFSLNLILEPRSEAAIPELKEYLENHNGLFHGTQIHFVKVEKILERVVFEAGNYNDAKEDPFVQSFALERSFAFSNLGGWENFTNQYGNALLNPENASFLSYVESLVASKAEFMLLRDHVLTVSDMVAIEPFPYLILEGEGVAGPEWEYTPFVPFKFFRNCFSARFESGVCYKP